MRSLHLFAGIGGGIIADVIAGNEIVGAVEINPFCRDVLRARQNDGSLPPFPIYNDVREIKGDEFGTVDLVCGGFPCQDISLAANTERKGLRGEKSGLFYELVRIVDVCEPAFVFLENVPAIIRNGLREVLQTFAERGFDAEWTTLSARACGAPHTRERWWAIMFRPDRLSDPARGGRQMRDRLAVQEAFADAQRLCEMLSEAGNGTADDEHKRAVGRSEERLSKDDEFRAQDRLSDPDCVRRRVEEQCVDAQKGERRTPSLCEMLPDPGNGTADDENLLHVGRSERTICVDSSWYAHEPFASRVVNGVPPQLVNPRNRALGNAQVPICAYLAYEILMNRIKNDP